MVPLRTHLKNGDIVEIMTQPGHKPSRDWLGYATTSRALQKIRHYILSEEKTRSLELGKRIFEKEARRFDVSSKLLTDDALLTAAREHGLQRIDDLIAAVGYGKISARQVLSKIVGVDELREKPPETGLASMVKRVLRPGADRIKVKGIDDLLVVRARCCNPIRGERIVGYISRGKGVSVHSASCSNVVNLMYDPDRRIEVEWDSAGQDDGAFTVRLAVQVEDKKGMVAAVSAKVAGMNTNIRSMEATTEDTRGRIDMTVEISDMKHLEKVIKSVKTVSGVLDVERVYR